MAAASFEYAWNGRVLNAAISLFIYIFFLINKYPVTNTECAKYGLKIIVTKPNTTMCHGHAQKSLVKCAMNQVAVAES